MLKKRKQIVSIIVPNYNNAKYLPECLDSNLNQTYRDIEIVIADDCSTDDSRSIIKSYAKKYPDIIRPLYLEKNLGVARARHEAIVKSKGEYITTLDADDYYLDSKKLEKEMELIRYYKENFDEDILAFSNIVIETADGSKYLQGTENNIVQGNALAKIISRSCMIPRDFTFLKSLYYQVGGYDFSFKTHEDWDLKIRLAAKYEFYYTGINGTVYRRREEGLSGSTNILIKNRNKIKVFNKNISLIKGKKEKLKVETTFYSFLKTRNDKIMLQKIKNNNLFYRFLYKLKNFGLLYTIRN